MKIRDVIQCIEEFAPLHYQENFDNAGLIVGNADNETNGAILCVDITEEVLDEAISKKVNFIISHHPIIFSGLKKIVGRNSVERIVAKAIKNDIALYAAHTNMDNIMGGVNSKICEKLGLVDCKILAPMKNEMAKIAVYVPDAYAKKIRNAMFDAGAGNVGAYSNCSYNISGEGTFKGNENSKPFVGEKEKLHTESETKIEMIVPKNNLKKVVAAIKNNHPYEEVAYDVYDLLNTCDFAGSGMVGNLPEAMTYDEFYSMLKDVFSLKVIRTTKAISEKVSRVAVCGGAGSFLLGDAIANQADIFVSADFKYHDFFNADGKITVADIGHFESEHIVIEIFCDIIRKKISNFATQITENITNPIIYIIY